MNKPAVKRNILSISQLNRQAKRLLESEFPSVWIEGEISNFSRPSSGHWYFSLKDDRAQVRCAMFRNSNSRLRFQPDSGQQVLARAKLSLYEARGDYQLIVEYLEPAGDGALARAFEQLKVRLQNEGLFSPEAKQELPSLPRHVAVVTSPTGAAIHDILNVMARRFPATKVTLFPSAVQGSTAAANIVSAIEKANSLAQDLEIDVLLISRGGGSIEDLWCFNDERVARAIFHSKLPTVSGVGHEVDFTIADFVADVRATTPSAAAELLTPDQEDMQASFLGFEQWLVRQVKLTLATAKQQLQWQRSRLVHPGSRLQEHSQRLDELELRLKTLFAHSRTVHSHRVEILKARLMQLTPRHLIDQFKLKTVNYYRQLEHQLHVTMEQKRLRLAATSQLLNTVSPLATLDRGYAITTDSDGRIIDSTEKLSVGDKVTTKLAKGTFDSSIIEKSEQ